MPKAVVPTLKDPKVESSDFHASRNWSELLQASIKWGVILIISIMGLLAYKCEDTNQFFRLCKESIFYLTLYSAGVGTPSVIRKIVDCINHLMRGNER